MKITKYGHACLDIRDDGGRLIVDPGVWTDQLPDYAGVTAVVITHVHADHLDESKVLKIVEQNPNVPIFCTEQAADKLSEDFNTIVPTIGTEHSAGPFTLEFFGGMHALIMDGMPQDQNFGVLVNGTLYYPGDSLTPCPKPHQVLAVASVAPWLKLSEAADFIRHDTAQIVFPTHNAIVNDIGNNMLNQMLGKVAEQTGKTYQVIKSGESLDTK